MLAVALPEPKRVVFYWIFKGKTSFYTGNPGFSRGNRKEPKRA
jgi:hypothetical protein